MTTDDVHEYVDKCVGIGGGKVCMGGFPHLLMKVGFPHLLMKGGFPQSQSKVGFPHLHMTGGFPHFQHQGVVCHTYFIDMVVFHTYVCSLSFCLNLGRRSRVSTPSLFVPSSDDTCRRGMNDGVNKWKKVVCFHTYIYGTI